MKIVWISANLFGYEVLREAIRYIRIQLLITLSKDSRTIMYDGIEREKWERITKLHGIEWIEIENINDEVDRLREIEPDYIVVAGWRQILSQEVLDIPKLGVIGFHPTPLPKGRGPAPIINQILLGWKESASTMFFYNDKMDAGDVIDRRFYNISNEDYAIDVYEKYIEATKYLIQYYFHALHLITLPRTKQDESKATELPVRTCKDNEIILYESLDVFDKKIRAFSYPYKGAFIKEGDKKLIIERCRLENE